MSEEEFLAKWDEIGANRDKQISTLQIKYAIANNPYKVGDRVKDHYQYGLIEKIRYTQSFGKNTSECIYSCISLKKDGTPRKDNSKISIFQSNIKDEV